MVRGWGSANEGWEGEFEVQCYRMVHASSE